MYVNKYVLPQNMDFFIRKDVPKNTNGLYL